MLDSCFPYGCLMLPPCFPRKRPHEGTHKDTTRGTLQGILRPREGRAPTLGNRNDKTTAMRQTRLYSLHARDGGIYRSCMTTPPMCKRLLRVRASCEPPSPPYITYPFSTACSNCRQAQVAKSSTSHPRAVYRAPRGHGGGLWPFKVRGNRPWSCC